MGARHIWIYKNCKLLLAAELLSRSRLGAPAMRGGITPVEIVRVAVSVGMESEKQKALR